MTIPTNGIQATQEVIIPITLPAPDPPSFFVSINVIICKTNITANGVYNILITMVAPRIGTPSNASSPPVTHLSIFDGDI